MRPVATALLIAIGAAAGVAMTQPGLARRLHDSKAQEDVYVLPPPAQLKAATLGQHGAAVDLLWAKLLVEWGMHLSEKRPFPDVFRYLDAILELEPDYAPLYQYADTLICYRPDGGTEADARLARQYLERGVKERPGDHDTWLHYGQFLAYMSPSYLPQGAELDAWKKDGAAAIAKAVDLGSDASRSLSAATLLAKYGEKDAAIRSLRRARALTDDPATQDEIDARLRSLEASSELEKAQDDARFIESQWRTKLPFVSRGTFMLLGPAPDAAKCAGHERSITPGCELDWSSALPSSKAD